MLALVPRKYKGVRRDTNSDGFVHQVYNPSDTQRLTANAVGLFIFIPRCKRTAIMEAASLKKVTSNLSLGVNGLPAAGDTSKSISSGTVGAGPAPTAAINSGRKLDGGPLTAKFTPADAGFGSQYPDPSSDEKVK